MLSRSQLTSRSSPIRAFIHRHTQALLAVGTVAVALTIAAPNVAQTYSARGFAVGGNACRPLSQGFNTFSRQHNPAPMGGIGGRLGVLRTELNGCRNRGSNFWFRYRWSDYQPWRNDGLRGYGSSYRSNRQSDTEIGISLPSWVTSPEEARKTATENRRARAAERKRRAYERAAIAEAARRLLPDPAKDTSDPEGRAFTADASALIAAGWQALRDGDSEEAVRLMGDACVAAPTRQDGRVALAIAASVAGRADVAAFAAKRADAISPAWREQLDRGDFDALVGGEHCSVAKTAFAPLTPKLAVVASGQ